MDYKLLIKTTVAQVGSVFQHDNPAIANCYYIILKIWRSWLKLQACYRMQWNVMKIVKPNNQSADMLSKLQLNFTHPDSMPSSMTTDFWPHFGILTRTNYAVIKN